MKRACLLMVLALSLSAAPVGAATEPLEFRRVDRQLRGPDDRFVWHAFVTDRAELRAVWDRYNLRDDIPRIRFRRRVAVFAGTGGSSSCPLRLLGLRLDREDRAIVARVRNGTAEDNACTDDWIPTTFVTSVSRADIPRGDLTVRVRRVTP